MSIAFYTCFFGNDSNWAHIVPKCSSRFDCYYITNSTTILKKLASTNWKPIFSDVPVYGNNIMDAMSAKLPKACPHLYPELQKYEYLVYFDSKVYDIDESQIENTIKTMESNHDQIIAMCKHPLPFHNVWDEFNLAMQYAKYHAQKGKNELYIKKQLESGIFSENIEDHYYTGFIIRKKSDLINEINNIWYEHIKECGIECQISFSFIHQLYRKNILTLEPKYAFKIL